MNPLTQNKDQSIGIFTETILLQKIKNWLGASVPDSPFGMGDDCAVIPNDFKTNLITVDALYYKTHFDDSVPPEKVGTKFLNRNISDIASMGGQPKLAVIGLTLPSSVSIDWLNKFCLGLSETANEYETLIVGGDLSESDTTLGGHLTLLGYSGNPVTRTRSVEGDLIFVTGELGGSILGKHYNFRPRVAEGRWLSNHSAVHSMIDLSDGMMKDLLELIPEDCCAELNLKNLPISDAAIKLSNKTKLSSEYHAVSDGEDYELLFTVDNEINKKEFFEKWQSIFKTRLTYLGILKSADKKFENKIIDFETGNPIQWEKGYEHFGKT